MKKIYDRICITLTLILLIGCGTPTSTSNPSPTLDWSREWDVRIYSIPRGQKLNFWISPCWMACAFSMPNEEGGYKYGWGYNFQNKGTYLALPGPVRKTWLRAPEWRFVRMYTTKNLGRISIMEIDGNGNPKEVVLAEVIFTGVVGDSRDQIDDRWVVPGCSLSSEGDDPYRYYPELPPPEEEK